METPLVQDAVLWPKIISDPQAEGLLRLGMLQVAHSLSDMVGHSIVLHRLSLETVPLDELMIQADDPETETVGVYLVSHDGLPSQAMLMLSVNDAMYLVDWLLEARPGTTTRLSQLEYSALAEVGNLAVCAFLKTMAEFTQSLLRPSPPSVIVDMLATILEVVSTSAAMVSDNLPIIKADFTDVHHSIQLRFWILPDADAFNQAIIEPKTDLAQVAGV
jgi:chemotaxis protein CheY-P-specific phosphatase CheC